MYNNDPKCLDRQACLSKHLGSLLYINSIDPDQTEGAVRSGTLGSTLFAIPSAYFGCIRCYMLKHNWASSYLTPLVLGDILLLPGSSVCPSVCLSVCPSQNRVHSVTWKTFKISSWNFIQILTNNRRIAEHKNHTACIYTFWVMPSELCK